MDALAVGGFVIAGSEPWFQATTHRADLYVDRADDDGDGVLDGEDVCPCGDPTPPSIDPLVASPATIWPANGKLVSVTVAASATDACDPAPSCRVASVISDTAGAEGRITGPLAVDLRAVVAPASFETLQWGRRRGPRGVVAYARRRGDGRMRSGRRVLPEGNVSRRAS